MNKLWNQIMAVQLELLKIEQRLPFKKSPELTSYESKQADIRHMIYLCRRDLLKIKDEIKDRNVFYG